MKENKVNDVETWSKAKILGEETWDITLFEHTEKGRNDLIEPHMHDFYLLLFIEKGEGIHEIDFTKHVVKPYQIYFLRPQQVHYWQLSGNTKGYQLMFSKNTINLIHGLSQLPFFQLGVPQLINLFPENYFNLKSTIEELNNLLLKNQNIDHEISILQFFLLLKKIQKLYNKEYPLLEQENKDLKIQEFKNLLEKYFTEHHQVAFYAEKLNITPNYLNIRCKKKLGITASQVIQQRIVLEAERLLITTNLPIKEIAFSLSFFDIGYFYHYFKKWVNKTPKEFRLSYNIYNKE